MSYRDYFAADYAEARRKFRAAAAMLGVPAEAIVHPLRGPGGEELAMDLAWFGAKDAAKVLVVISGTHGAEGYCGSGCQVHGLATGLYSDLPRDTAVLMIHAINPWGFAHTRRVNEDNVDLNRNFHDWSKPLPENADYELVADAVLPEALAGPGHDKAQAKIDAFVKEKGEARYYACIGQGQYRHPTGLFYGGAGPVWSNQRLSEICKDRLAKRRHVVFIDIHTGLGPYGYGQLITDPPAGHGSLDRARSWFGHTVTVPSQGTSFSTVKAGLMEMGLVRMIPQSALTHVALEFGTYDSTSGRKALREENWLHHKGGANHPEAARMKAALLRQFYPDTEDWREMIVPRTAMVARQALRGMAEMG